jgi:hypothetical protein
MGEKKEEEPVFIWKGKQPGGRADNGEGRKEGMVEGMKG